jgi:hypothetical protein
MEHALGTCMSIAPPRRWSCAIFATIINLYSSDVHPRMVTTAYLLASGRGWERMRRLVPGLRKPDLPTPTCSIGPRAAVSEPLRNPPQLD